MGDPLKIYLEPDSCACAYEGRLWAENDIGSDHPETGEYVPWVEYIRADLRESDIKEIARLLVLIEELKADRIRINDEAETEIAGLRVEIKRLRGALEPFKAVEILWPTASDDSICLVSLGAVRGARKALEEK